MKIAVINGSPKDQMAKSLTFALQTGHTAPYTRLFAQMGKEKPGKGQ